MQTRSSDENSIGLSVMRELWQNGKKICQDLYTIWKNISLVFWEEEWLVGGSPFEISDFPIYFLLVAL